VEVVAVKREAVEERFLYSGKRVVVVKAKRTLFLCCIARPLISFLIPSFGCCTRVDLH
jgi:hypothetical protein